MKWQGCNPGLLPNLFLAAFLLAAQFGALAHAFEHDAGAPQDNVCSTCASASQLASACVDSHFPAELEPLPLSFVTNSIVDARSVRAIVARQRGPPASR